MNTKKRNHRPVSRVIAVSLALSILMVTASALVSAVEMVPPQSGDTAITASVSVEDETGTSATDKTEDREEVQQVTEETEEAIPEKEDVDPGMEAEQEPEQTQTQEQEPEQTQEQEQNITDKDTEKNEDNENFQGLEEATETGKSIVSPSVETTDEELATHEKPRSWGRKVSHDSDFSEYAELLDAGEEIKSDFTSKGQGILEATLEGQSIHQKPNISDITGEIAEPPEITSNASALATEKAWYEYIYYSEKPVGYYYLNNTTRVTFFDPYDYNDTLMMEVKDVLTDWSSNNSLQVSYTTSSSTTDVKTRSTNSSTSVQRTTDDDIYENVTGERELITWSEGKIETYNYSKSGDTHEKSYDHTWSSIETVTTGEEVPLIGGKIEIQVGSEQQHGYVETDTTQDSVASYEGEDYDTSSRGYSIDNTKKHQIDPGGSSTITKKIADRITDVIGNSISTSVSLSTTDSVTITKTYDAAHFTENGTPYQWKIVKYTVFMPLMYQVEYLIEDEWVHYDTNFCLLTTIQGTCRSWLENNNAYYEHWGTGEKVSEAEFWSQFFTKEQLVEAYKNRLYPDR